MIAFDELLRRFGGLDARELAAWIEAGWVLPRRRDRDWAFEEVDIARVALILDIRRELAIDDEALPVVLGLIDQLYAARRQMRRLCDALAAQPPEVRAAVERALAPLAEEG